MEKKTVFWDADTQFDFMSPAGAAYVPAPSGRATWGDVPIDTVDIDEVERAQLQRLVHKPPFHIVIRKQSLNGFDNPNTHKRVDLVRPAHVIALGVALDCCVYHMLSGLAKHQGVKLSLLADATRGLQIRPDEQICDELRQRGVEITTGAEIVNRLRLRSLSRVASNV